MGDREADRILVERVQAGDKQAFGLLVTKYQRKLGRLISRMVRDSAEVEDIVQDSFIRAYRALPGFAMTVRFTHGSTGSASIPRKTG
jgi:RNA polymerase sigma-70 factor (ECF subfamily)